MPILGGCRVQRISTAVADHSLCAIGVYTHNLQPSPAQQADLGDALKVFSDHGYVRPKTCYLFRSLPRSLDTSSMRLCRKLLCRQTDPVHQCQPDPDSFRRNAAGGKPESARDGQARMCHRPPGHEHGTCSSESRLLRSTRLFGCTDRLRRNLRIPGAKLEAYTERTETLSKANSLLSKFHQIRRHDIEGGQMPTIAQSLAALS
jgi:hypothetical protein